MNSENLRKTLRLTTSHYIFAGVLLIRVVVVARLAFSASLLPTRGDMHFYDHWARQIVGGHLTDHLAFYGLPGYAYLLAFVYNIFGYNPLIPALLQSLFDAGTAVLIYRIAVRLFSQGGIRQGEIAGTLAALGWAFFVPAQTYAAILMPTALGVFVFWMVVWVIVGSDKAPEGPGCFGLGLLIGVTATMIATVVFLVPAIVAAVALKRNRVPRPRKKLGAVVISLVLIAAGLIGGTAPCWIHNYFVAHDPVFLSAHSGINFWIGNNPAATGYPRFPPGLRAGQTAMLEDSIRVAEAAAGHPLRRGEVSQYWSGKARDYIEHNFAAWLRLLLIKLRNVLNAFQYDDLSVITSLREQGVTLPGIYFGLICALALPALFLTWRNVPLSRWLSLAILLQILALLPVFTTERYRLPIVPGLCIFAGGGLVLFWQSLSEAKLVRVISYSLLLTGSVALASTPQRDPSLWALDAYNSGLQALDSGDIGQARQKLDLAYAYSPLNAEVNFAEGNLELAVGDRAGAKNFYRSTLRLNPNHPGAYNNLGILALQENRWSLAASFFTAALQRSPNDPKLHYLLAQAHLSSGDRERARSEIAEAIRLNPQQPEFRSLQQLVQAH